MGLSQPWVRQEKVWFKAISGFLSLTRDSWQEFQGRGNREHGCGTLCAEGLTVWCWGENVSTGEASMFFQGGDPPPQGILVC